ncbi:MAG: hypothetical protein AUI93_04455 [Crenarchaeota archaeon 13_1_40CM_3_52_10]|nr:MAG: hypothetical protein AUI93_04455 [Crenarchaeota archaeon 13_1_40CM_3_52_10]
MSTIGDISTRTKWLVSKRYIQAIIVIGLMTLAIAVPLFTRAFAITDVGSAGVFELDGNIVKDSSGTFPTDWSALFSSTGSKLALPPGGVDSGWTNDGPHSVSETTTFTTGSKDTLDIANNGWQCTGTNNLTPKDDILHAYSFAIRDPLAGPRNGHLLIYGGFERFANNGAGDLGYWLLADPSVSCVTSGATTSFTGAHTVGDLLVVGEFSTGGSVTTLSVIEWTGAGPCATPAGPNLCLITTPGNADCQLASSLADVCARVNIASQSPITTPWATQDKTSSPNQLATAEFFEVGLDITNLLPSSSGCFNKFLFDTRTSPSTTATLKDYAEGILATCPTAGISTTASPTPIALGGSSTDNATVTLTNAAGIVSGNVVFNVYGPFNSAPTSSSCTPSSLVTSFTKTIGPATQPQSVLSDPFTPTLPGYYGWIATYNPASVVNGNIVSTVCGDPVETLVVIQALISTTVSPPIITFGGSATDTATVTLTPGTATVSGTVDFKVYGPVATNNPTCTTQAGSFPGVTIGPGVSPQSATSGSFTPSATGFYFWIATYNPAGAANGNMVSSTCGATGETLQVVSIPKITAFGFTNTPTGNDPTLGSGTVVYSFTIHNYGATGTSVTLSGSLAVSGTANTISCATGNPLTLSGSLAGGADAMFSLTCTYSGISGQNVQATINANFTDLNGVTGAVSGSPTTYIFTIQTS